MKTMVILRMMHGTYSPIVLDKKIIKSSSSNRLFFPYIFGLSIQTVMEVRLAVETKTQFLRHMVCVMLTRKIIIQLATSAKLHRIPGK